MKNRFSLVTLWDNSGGSHAKALLTWKDVTLEEITSEVCVAKYFSEAKKDAGETKKWSLECHFPQVSI